MNEMTREYQAARQNVALIDLSDRGLLRMSGPDAAAVLQGIFTSDVKSLVVGQGQYSLMLNDIGRMQLAVRLYRTEDGFLIECPPEMAQQGQQMIDYYIISENAEITVQDNWGMLSLQGPLSQQLLEQLMKVPVEGEYNCCHSTFQSAPIFLARHSRTGETGFDIWMESKLLSEVWNGLLEAGKPLGMSPLSRQALEILRVEAGIAEFGAEISLDYNPLEAGLEPCISFDKGCYLGQEIIARITNLSKPVRRLTGILSDQIIPPGTRLTSANQEVGVVTSSVMSIALNRPAALGYVKRTLAADAQIFATTDKSVTASLCGLPLVEKKVTGTAPTSTQASQILPF